MIASELARKIRVIQILATKAVSDLLAGRYQSVFRGRGMEFLEVREYQPGDDVRAIDRNVTARMGRPFVKIFREERELTIVLLVDLSASGRFGSGQRTKNEAAAELCALLAFAAIRNNDKVGLVVFTDSIEKHVPPKRGVAHVLRVIREILSFEPEHTGTDIAGALAFAGRVFKRRAVVFLVSDFQAHGFEQPLRVLARRHDLIAVRVSDPREMSLPDVGLIDLEDAENGRTVLIDTGSAGVRARFEQLSAERSLWLRDLFRSARVDEIEISAGTPYVVELVKFFKARQKRRGRN